MSAGLRFYVLSFIFSCSFEKGKQSLSACFIPPTLSSPMRSLLDRVSSEVYVIVIFPMTLSEKWHTAWEVEVHFLKQMLQVS